MQFYPPTDTNDDTPLLGGSNANNIQNVSTWQSFDVSGHVPAGAVGFFRGRIKNGTGWLCISPVDSSPNPAWKSLLENQGGSGGCVPCRTGADGRLRVWYQGTPGSIATILLDGYATEG